MSTIDNWDEEFAAGAGALQPTDKIPIHEASSSRKKYLTGALFGAGATGVVVSTATAVSVSATVHANKILIMNTNSASGFTITLPAATGTGNKYEIINGIAQTQGTLVIKTAGSDVMRGRCMSFDSSAIATHANFFVTATATQSSWNRTTTGGLGQDRLVAYDESAAVWHVMVETNVVGSNATPFS